jgi:hypothetical protein
MDLNPTTILPQKEDDEKALLQRFLYGRSKKVTGVALASAARTATTQSADIDLTGYSALAVFHNCTVASGTGGLTITLRGKDPISGTYVQIANLNIAKTSAVGNVVCFGPGCGVVNLGTLGAGHGGAGVCLPDTVRIEVGHADGSSYTYSVGFCKIP